MTRLGVVLLAAGASTRMGSPKLLLPWRDTSVLGHLLRQWKQLGAHQIAVVCAPSNPDIDRELDRLGFASNQRIYNSSPEQGMHSSILCAARWTAWDPTLTHWSVVLGDQPHLRLETLRKLITQANGDAICQPSHQGRGRHPVLLSRRFFQGLTHSPATTLKEFLVANASHVTRVEMNDPGLDLDVDRPEDYLAARRLGGEGEEQFR